jgi:hypothetical protein
LTVASFYSSLPVRASFSVARRRRESDRSDGAAHHAGF